MKSTLVVSMVMAGLLTSFTASAADQATANANQNAVSGSTSLSAGNTSNNANTSTATQSSNTSSTANNAGNNQNNASTSGVQSVFNPTIEFNQPAVSTINQTVNGTTTQNQNVNQTINQNVSGTTTQNQNVNQTSTANINNTGKTEQVLSGTRTENINYRYEGEYKVKNVPSMNAPPLTSSNDTCMGSLSGSVAVAGFGLGAGSTYTDEHCKRIKMSRELWNKGMKAASLALDCMDRDAKEALELTGFLCPQTERELRNLKPDAPVTLAPTTTLSAAPTARPAVRAAGFDKANLNDPYIARRAN